jgi:hypothetical protein
LRECRERGFPFDISIFYNELFKPLVLMYVSQNEGKDGLSFVRIIGNILLVPSAADDGSRG